LIDFSWRFGPFRTPLLNMIIVGRSNQICKNTFLAGDIKALGALSNPCVIMILKGIQICHPTEYVSK
jgi:hypothetical protein